MSSRSASKTCLSWLRVGQVLDVVRAVAAAGAHAHAHAHAVLLPGAEG